MANNNLLTDLPEYCDYVAATHVYKNSAVDGNGSPASRFFAYVGPNGKELEGNEVFIASQRDADFVGVLDKNAIARDMANGVMKYGQQGVSMYAFRMTGAAGTPADVVQTMALMQPGQVMAVFALTEAGASRTVECSVNGNSVLAASQTTTANSAASGKAKKLALTSTAANLSVKPAAAASGVSVTLKGAVNTDTAVIVVAIAHHSF